MSHPQRNLSHIRAALYSEPWMISDGGLDLLLGIVESHAAGTLPEAAIQLAGFPGQERERVRGLEMVGDVAVVSVQGPIFPKSNFMTAMSGATSSAEIGRALDAAVDNEPSAIVLHIDSPGGAVTGAFELADKIHVMRDELPVPIVAAVEGMGASLAYLLASQTEAIYLTRTSSVGSVSVVFRAQNPERAMRNAGVDAITLRSGDRKQVESVIAAGNSTTGQMSGVLRSIDKLHEMFVAAVQRGRPGMDAPGIATGEMWTGSDAVDAGVADGVMTLQQIIDSLG